jgi:hypothetical protein
MTFVALSGPRRRPKSGVRSHCSGGEWPNQKLLELPDGERQALIDAVVTGLVGLPRDFRRDQAVRTVLDDLGRAIPLRLVEPSLERSEAGEVLRRQRQQEADRAFRRWPYPIVCE